MTTRRGGSRDGGPEAPRPERAPFADPPAFFWPTPVALREARARRRAAFRGSVSETVVLDGPGPCFRAVLNDGTGELALVFLGREAVPGIVEGAQLEVEGMVGRFRAEPAILNPRYRFTGAPRRTQPDTSW